MKSLTDAGLSVWDRHKVKGFCTIKLNQNKAFDYISIGPSAYSQNDQPHGDMENFPKILSYVKHHS